MYSPRSELPEWIRNDAKPKQHAELPSAERTESRKSVLLTVSSCSCWPSFVDLITWSSSICFGLCTTRSIGETKQCCSGVKRVSSGRVPEKNCIGNLIGESVDACDMVRFVQPKTKEKDAEEEQTSLETDDTLQMQLAGYGRSENLKKWNCSLAKSGFRIYLSRSADLQ